MASGLHSLESWLEPAALQLVNIAAAAGLTPRVASARRSHAQQALLYRRYLAGQSRFPAAPPGNSMHELGLAFDLWVNDETQLADLGQVWEQMGGVWGGHFKDPIHFEAGGDLSDYAQAAAPEATSGAISSLVDTVGSFAPGIGEITAGADLAKTLGADPNSPFIQVLSSPSKMIYTQPQFQALAWLWRKFGF